MLYEVITHAGEFGGPDSVLAALEFLRVKRILLLVEQSAVTAARARVGAGLRQDIVDILGRAVLLPGLDDPVHLVVTSYNFV